MLYYGKYTLMGLAGRFFTHTRPGKFISGTFLGMFSLTGLIALLLPWTRHLTKLLLAGASFRGWWEDLHLSDIVPALAMAIFFAVIIGYAALFFLLRRQEWKNLLVVLPLGVLLAMSIVLLKYKEGADPSVIRNLLYTLAGIVYLPFSIVCGIWLAMIMPRFGEGEFLRGAQKLEGNDRQIEKQLYARYKKANRGWPEGIKIYKSVSIPFPKENEGTVIIGSPGSGKTQIINGMINDVRRRGGKMIIWDVKGGYLQAFAGEPGVKILCPWDKRSIAWRLGADVLRILDCHQAAHTLIREKSNESQPHFPDSARNILAAVLIQLDAMGNKWGWQDVWDVISKGKDELHAFLQRTDEGIAAATALGGDTKAAHDVYSTLMTALQPSSLLAKAWGNEGISLREWVNDPDSKVLIIGGLIENEKLAVLTARLSLQIMVNEVLAMPDDLSRRVVFFLDELATLERHKTLIDAFTTGRSKGLCIVAGIQDIGRIEDLYGRELTKSILNVFSTFVFLRCSDSATSRWASEALGEQETWDFVGETKNATLDESKNRNIRYKPLFMPAEIANFQNLTGVLKIADWPVAKVTWPLNPIPQKYPRVVDADWVNQKAKLNDPPDNKKKTNEPPAPNPHANLEME